MSTVLGFATTKDYDHKEPPCVADLCRICSGPGEYDIKSPIPIYLHGSRREAVAWPERIDKMIGNITGIDIYDNDNLPHKICRICISYLKHAVNFRNQAINTVLNLSVALSLSTPTTSSPPDFSRNIINSPPDNVPDSINLNSPVDKIELNEDNLERFLIDEGQPIIGIADRTCTKNPFGYHETEFIEDDVTKLPIFKNDSTTRPLIEFLPARVYKERKCTSCNQRFMFSESFDAHVRSCIEAQLVAFINELNFLFDMRKYDCITGHEFVRRSIYSIRKSLRILSAARHDLVEVQNATHEEAGNRLAESSNQSKIMLAHIKANYDDATAKELPESERQTQQDQFYFNKLMIYNNLNTKINNGCKQATTINNSNNYNSHNIHSNHEHNTTSHTKKAVQCSKCEISLPTITHLDLHIRKCSARTNDN